MIALLAAILTANLSAMQPEPMGEPRPPEPEIFHGVVIETDPENAEILASGRYFSKTGRLVVPISADAYALPRAFTVTIKSTDYPTLRKRIEAHLDWVHFLMLAGPVALVGVGNALPLLDAARLPGDKVASGLTVAGAVLTIGQIYFQSFRFDDVYAIDLERETRP